MRPLGLSEDQWSLGRCGSRIAWPLRWIANPVVFHLGSSNLPCRSFYSGHELYHYAVTGVCDVYCRFDYRHFSDIINSSDIDSQEAFRDVSFK